MVDSWQVQDGQGLHALDENQQLRLADGYGVIDPGGGACAVTANNQTLGQSDTLSVAQGDVIVDGTSHSLSQTAVGVDAANPTDPRRDVVYVDGTGALQVAKGTPESTEPVGQNLSRFEFFRPAPPDLSGTTATVLAEVWVAAGASSVETADIRDRRLRALGPHSLDEDIATQAELNTHAGNPSIHHTPGGFDTISTHTSSDTLEDREVALGDASGGAITLTLPSPAAHVEVAVKKTDASTNAVTVATPNSETIDGMSSLSITNQYAARTLVCDGSDYFVI